MESQLDWNWGDPCHYYQYDLLPQLIRVCRLDTVLKMTLGEGREGGRCRRVRGEGRGNAECKHVHTRTMDDCSLVSFTHTSITSLVRIRDIHYITTCQFTVLNDANRTCCQATIECMITTHYSGFLWHRQTRESLYICLLPLSGTHNEHAMYKVGLLLGYHITASSRGRQKGDTCTVYTENTRKAHE